MFYKYMKYKKKYLELKSLFGGNKEDSKSFPYSDHEFIYRVATSSIKLDIS